MPELISYYIRRLALCIALALIIWLGGIQCSNTVTKAETSHSSNREQDSIQKITEIEIFVDGTKGSDDNRGTRDRPVSTIGKAIRLARFNNRRSIPTRILINQGTYRESAVWVAVDGETDAALTIMAYDGGFVTISGADIWLDWQTDKQNPDLIVHHWPYQWDLCSPPRGWPIMQDIVRRREMIFVNGKLFKQVLSFDDMQEGTFFVDKSKALVFVLVPQGINTQTAKIEVAVRPELLRFQGKSNLTLRGLSFVHANSCVAHAAVSIFGGSNNLVEDSEFNWNNWTGFTFGSSFHATVKRIRADHNGGAGVEGYALNRAIYQDVEVSENNWRGASGNFCGWAVAGAKLMRIHKGSFTRIKAIGNYTRGFWLDFDNRDIVVDSLYTAQNQRDGIFLEASQGPITIMNSRICHNGSEGVLISNSSWVKLKENIIYENKKSQIFASGEIEGRRVEDRETHDVYTLIAKNWNITQNVIIGFNLNRPLIGTNQTALNWNEFLDSLTSDKNTWYSPSAQYAFQLNTWNSSGTPKLVDLEAWRKATGHDKNSVFAHPTSDLTKACTFP